jgi:hypothetical protein
MFEHVKPVCAEGGLEKEPPGRKFRTTAADGETDRISY